METLGMAIAACKDQMTNTLRSKHTARAYKKGLDVFMVYLLDEYRITGEAPLSALDIDKFVNFPVWALRRETRPTALVRASAAKYFLDNWLVQRGLIEPSYADGLRLKRAMKDITHKSRSLPKRLAEAPDVEKMVETARQMTDDEPLRSLRLAMVSLMATSGIRVEELTKLACRDLDLKKCEVFIRSGKENKDRLVIFAGETANDIAHYWQARGWSGRDDPAFSNYGRRVPEDAKVKLTTNRARFVIEQLEKASGIEGHVTPHSLRHYFATRVLRETRSIELVKRFLGHSSVSVTQIYLDLDTTDLHIGHKEAFEDWGKK